MPRAGTHVHSCRGRPVIATSTASDARQHAVDAFVEWSATFDCADDERDRWVDYFEREGFARWLGSLREMRTERQPL
jgi:hypothetical protein